MKKLLQPTREGEHWLYARFRDWPDPHSAERRQFFCALWKKYEPFAPKDFAKKLQIEFHQRWWEMYLTVAMLHLGFRLTPCKSDHGPDLSLDIGDRRVFMEATAPSVGTKSDRVPDPIHNGVAHFPERECLLRLTQALTDKCKRFHDYVEGGVVPRDSCFIIALSGSDLNQFGRMLDGVHPAPLSVLAGAGPMVITIGGAHPPYSSRRETIERDSGSDVDACLFEKPEFRIISGILYSPADLWNAKEKPEEAISLFLNPDPDSHLPQAFTSKFVHWRQEKPSVDESEWRKTQPNRSRRKAIAARTRPLLAPDLARWVKRRKIMIEATQNGFTRRRSGQGIIFTVHYDRNTPLPEIRLQDCDDAVLKLGDQNVLIYSVRPLPNGRFTGVVRGFEPAFSEEVKGIKIGDEIIFDDEHVFSAGESR